MTLLFDGEMHVHYRQFSVESREDDASFDLPDMLGGQTNGLCGAAVPGLLFLSTGLHTGNVKVTVEVLDAPPPVGEDWEDVVEVSFRPGSDVVRLVQWAGEQSWPLALEQIDYRVRYCASGMDAGFDKDTRSEGEPLVDRYLMQLWPAAPAADLVVRQASDQADTWHRYARRLPLPPSPENQQEGRPAEEHANAQPADGPPAWGAMAPHGRLAWLT